MENRNLPIMLQRGLKGPINFFPLFFFHEDLDECWQLDFIDTARLEHMHFNSYIKNLEKAPLAYLSEQDLKVLFFLEAGHAYEKIIDDVKKGEEPPIEFLFKLEAIAKVYQANFMKKSCAFIPLSQAFISFFHGLMYKGDRSRKLMSLAEHHMAEAVGKMEQKLNHPYGMLFIALTQIGRGQWDQATDTLKDYSDLKPGPQICSVLTRLYAHMGMHDLAAIFKQKQKDLTPVTSSLAAF